MNRDVLKTILSRLDLGSLKACRLVSKEWLECSDAVTSSVRSDYLSCHGASSIGEDVEYLSINGVDSQDVSLVMRKSKDEWDLGVSWAACDMLEYKGITPAHACVRHRVPYKLKCAGMLTRHQSACIGSLGTLRCLDLSALLSTEVPKERRAMVCASIRDLRNLEVLHMPGCGISARDMRWISDTPSSITDLDVFRNSLSEEGALHLSKMTALTRLDISNNDIREGIRHLSKLTSLKELRVGYNGGSDEALAACLKDMASLDSLTLAWNEADALTGSSLENKISLTELNASFGNAATLSSHISGLTNLTSLDLSFGGLSDYCVRHLSDMSRLETLKASNNELTNIGVRIMCVSSYSSGLKELELGWNEIGFQGATVLSEAMTGLERLDIRKNEILDSGVYRILRMPCIRELKASGNGLSETTMRRLRSEVKTRGVVML